jgi:hypothetical protein
MYFKDGSASQFSAQVEDYHKVSEKTGIVTEALK